MVVQRNGLLQIISNEIMRWHKHSFTWPWAIRTKPGRRIQEKEVGVIFFWGGGHNRKSKAATYNNHFTYIHTYIGTYIHTYLHAYMHTTSGDLYVHIEESTILVVYTSRLFGTNKIMVRRKTYEISTDGLLRYKVFVASCWDREKHLAKSLKLLRLASLCEFVASSSLTSTRRGEQFVRGHALGPVGRRCTCSKDLGQISSIDWKGTIMVCISERTSSNWVHLCTFPLSMSARYFSIITSENDLSLYIEYKSSPLRNNKNRPKWDSNTPTKCRRTELNEVPFATNWILCMI